MKDDYDFRIMRVLRRRLNLTLQELADRAGVTYPTVASVETSKTLPSLKTLDALAGALLVSTSDLLGLAERRRVQRRTAKVETCTDPTGGDEGLEKCRVARFDKGKLIRVAAEAGERVCVMSLHEDVHEFCYVLNGCVDLQVGEKTYRLRRDDTILFDGLQDHSYTQVETGEYVTAHIPKDIRILERLLETRNQGQ